MEENSLAMVELRRLASTVEAVEVFRDRLTREPLVGAILGVSPHVVVLELSDPERGMGGVTAFRPADITRLRTGGRALELSTQRLREKPKRSPLDDIALLELSSAVTVFQRSAPLITLFLEELDPETALIGRMEAVDDDYVLLDAVAPLDRLERTRMVIRYDEITRVAADGSYEQGLARSYGLL